MGNVAGSLGGHFTIYANVYEISTNIAGNYSTVRMDEYLGCDSTGTGLFDLTGGPSYSGNVNGNVASGNFNYDFRGNANTILLRTFDTNVAHDANGNGSCGWSTSVNMNNSPYATTGSNSSSISLTRLPLAPTFASITADTVRTTSVRLGAEISSYGHGTGANFEMYHRLQGSGTWISNGIQADVGGFNYWSISGLTPGRIYEYICNCTNNNGDFAQSGTQTFSTTPVSGMITVMKAMV